MIYLYKCNACQSVVESTSRGDTLGECPFCPEPFDATDTQPGELRRKFVVAFEPLMHSHFNHSVGEEVSDMKQYRAKLQKAGEAYTERTGMPTDYQPLTQGEIKGMMTMEGMDSTNRVRRSQGLPAIEV